MTAERETGGVPLMSEPFREALELLGMKREGKSTPGETVVT